MSKPRLLDLFCGEGGASMGFHRAGFDVVGVDIEPQPRYPFEFHQADAIEFCNRYGKDFDVIAGGPPCKAMTGMQHLGTARNGSYPTHVNLIPETREAMKSTGKPYIIENVAGARKHLINPIVLCGKQFGLKVYRHRYFETSFFCLMPPHLPHRDSTPSAGNGISPNGFISVAGTGGVKGMTSDEIIDYWSMAMGIDWMSRYGLSQAVPPAYTKWIGEQILEAIRKLNSTLVSIA